jgi:hypothetical protein
MNKIVPVSERAIADIVTTSPQTRIEAEKMRDLTVIIEGLCLREEIAIKSIIDCLYDIGHVRAIDRKVRFRPFNIVAKFLAKRSKSIARIIAWRWLKKNCPTLIAEWLYTQVKF